MEDEQNQLTSPPLVETSSATAGASAEICSNSNDAGIASNDGFVHKEGRKRNQQHGRSAATPTRVKTQDLQTKDFNYSRVNSKLRRHQQIDDLDKSLREEQETSRRLRSAVLILEGKLNVAEEGRRRSNGLERAFFSHLTEVETLVLQRDRLMAPGADETRAQCLEAARREAHERLANILQRELGRNSARRSDGAVDPGDRCCSNSTTVHRTAVRTPAQEKSVVVNTRQQTRNDFDATVNPAWDRPEQADRERHRSPEIPCRRNNQGKHGTDCSYSPALREGKQTEIGLSGSMNGVSCPPPPSPSCWESDAVMHAYRSAAAGAVRRMSSALFGQELLAVEAARASAAERERMLQEETRVLLDSQVSLQLEKDQLEGVKASLRAEVREAKADLKKAKEKNRQQQDMVKDAERVHSSLSWRILSLQVARDELSQAVGERLRVIQTAVCRRVGFLPRAVEGAVNDLVALCSAPGPSDGALGDGNSTNSTSIEKGLLLAGNSGSSVSTSTSRTSSHKS